MTTKRVIVTGGSGLLGRAVSIYLQRKPTDGPVVTFDVQRWVFSRLRNEKTDRKVDISKRDEVFKAVDEFKPDVIVHCAAIRAPDIVDKQEDFAKEINVVGTQYIAEAAAQHKAKLIYISTDYVFDGKNPPYSESSIPNPINVYGEQKLLGEHTATAHCPGAIVLRVPILYGPVEFLGEGAVDVILKALLNKDAPCEMSNYERRYPTHVDDVAAVIRLLLERYFADPNNTIYFGIFHWSGDEEMTKYDMAKIMGDVFSLPIDHLKAASDPPATATTQRPYNAKLSCQRLLDLGARNRYNFKTGIESLRKFVPLK